MQFPSYSKNHKNPGWIKGHHLIGKKGRRGRWNGGRWKSTEGYVYIHAPDHPQRTQQGYILEHRYVMEKKLGRLLVPSESVHHINGIKDDNAPENLVVLTRQEHHRHHGHSSNLVPMNKTLAAKVWATRRKRGH